MKILKSIMLPTLLSLSLTQCSEAEKETKDAKDQKTSEEAKKAVELFDHKTLKGWKTVNPNFAKYWSVVDGVITVSNGKEKMPTNTYLATEKDYEDFEFTCKFRLTGDHATGFINSGVQYRSNIHTAEGKAPKIVGYQADLGKGYWGNIYDEHRRGHLVKANLTEVLKQGFKEEAWGTYKIVCQGDHHQVYINGLLVADYTEKDAKMPKKGVIALQLHSGGVAKMEYKDIFVKEL